MEPTSFDTFGPLMVEQLREQVGNLMAAVHLLTPMVREGQDGRCDQYLAIMNQSLYRLLRLTGNLEFAALPLEEGAYRDGSLDLAGLCRELAAQVEALAGQMGVAFCYEESRASLLTMGDAVLLRRMLLNLISNALRSAGKGGEAGLRLRAEQGRCTLTVWDNGPGLELGGAEIDDLLSRPGGVGLGLAVARRAAELHGGVLVFDQREGRGGRATVSLPVREPDRTASLRSPTAQYDATGGFSPVLVELSGVLPYQAYLPQDME